MPSTIVPPKRPIHLDRSNSFLRLGFFTFNILNPLLWVSDNPGVRGDCWVQALKLSAKPTNKAAALKVAIIVNQEEGSLKFVDA